VKASGLLIDLDGTLYVGDEPIPGAVDAIRWFEERGIARRYLTNTTRRSRREIAGRLRGMGFPLADDELFTAPVAAASWLRDHGIERVSLYFDEAAHEDFDGFAIDYDSPQAVVVGDLGRDWTFDTLNRAFRQLAGGARLVALQRNRFWQTERGLELDAGPFVALLEHAADVEAMLVGKPSEQFFDLAVRAMDLPRRDVLVVGDDVETDIGGAHTLGLRGVLVRTGKFRDDWLEKSGIVPYAIVDSIAKLPEMLA
jgi:HAD superfamily hydrolase (TIGR01458 family)